MPKEPGMGYPLNPRQKLGINQPLLSFNVKEEETHLLSVPFALGSMPLGHGIQAFPSSILRPAASSAAAMKM